MQKNTNKYHNIFCALGDKQINAIICVYTYNNYFVKTRLVHYEQNEIYKQ